MTHKDRLLGLGAELIFAICEHVGCEAVVISYTRKIDTNGERITERFLGMLY